MTFIAEFNAAGYGTPSKLRSGRIASGPGACSEFSVVWHGFKLENMEQTSVFNPLQ